MVGKSGIAYQNDRRPARGAMWANWIGVGTLEVIAVLLGTAAAYVIGGSDPTTWMIPLGGVTLGIIALVFVCIGNISSNAIVMYATCLGMKQYKFFANMSWLKVTAIYVTPVVILEFMPEVLYGNYQILLNGSGAFFSSLAAVQIVDFYLLRKEHFDLRSVYNGDKRVRILFLERCKLGRTDMCHSRRSDLLSAS